MSVLLMQRPPSGAKHRRTESMPDALLKIIGHRSHDHTSLMVTSDDVSNVLSEEQETKMSTVSDDSCVSDKLSVRLPNVL